MIHGKCLSINRDVSGEIVSYTMQYSEGEPRDETPGSLRFWMDYRQINISNLMLNADKQIVECDKPISEDNRSISEELMMRLSLKTGRASNKDLRFRTVSDLKGIIGKSTLIGIPVYDLEEHIYLINKPNEALVVSDKQLVLDPDSSSVFSEIYYNNIDLTGLNSSRVRTTDYMFDYTQGNIIWGDFDTSNVTSMMGMFRHYKATDLNLSSFDTSKVKNMHAMFASASIKNLNVSKLDTANVTDMSDMFEFYAGMVLDLRGFNTSKVENMTGTFKRCSARSINISSFTSENLHHYREIFEDVEASVIMEDDRLKQIYEQSKSKD